MLNLASRACCGTLRCVPRVPTSPVAGLTHARIVPRASDKDDQPMMSMSTDDAVKILGVSATASFDEILARKNQLLAAAGSDQEAAMDIENAYDVIFMQSMRKRLTGENVSSKVRFADVPATPRKSAQASRKSSTLSLPKLPGGTTLAIAPPKQELAVQQAAVFGVLGVWAILQATLESPEAQMADTGGLQLSLALAYAVYTLKENKRMGLGKAVGLSFAALVVGALLGTAVQNWVRVDIVPLGAFQSPGIFCTEFVLVGLLLGSLFLV